jgi:hypothetical protein
MSILLIIILAIAVVLLVLMLVGVPVSQKAYNILFLTVLILLALNQSEVI